MKVLVPVADGVEDMELIVVADVLRRADWEVVLAGIGTGAVTAARGARLLPDADWAEARAAGGFGMLVIPGGGGGVNRLREDATVLECVRRFARGDLWLAAICAGPLVLESAGVLSGRRVTAYPSAAAGLESATLTDAAVVRDGRLITGRGPGVALLFALTLVESVQPGMAMPLADAMACGPEIAEALGAVQRTEDGRP